MNLTESYNKLYLDCEKYNDLVTKESQIEKDFTDLENFLSQNQSDIKLYDLIPDIEKMFPKYRSRIPQIKVEIKELIRQKREEIERLRQLREEEERKRRERRKKIIKWALIALAIIIAIIVLIKIIIPFIVALVTAVVTWIEKNLLWIIVGIVIIAIIIYKSANS